ncbi:hypothetical protein SAMN05216238_106134 [Lentibacillus persicus]|uniref:Uncharacterized protein n=1 Tax=Lentibacillus persicus TaxID=640948 RepID=A0A1I1WKJ2_9BACI|nr:hypothetical protein SAMN05216238_106134 [Lentibacillus persicus]
MPALKSAYCSFVCLTSNATLFKHSRKQLEYARLLWDSEPKRPRSERFLLTRRLVESPRKASIFQLRLKKVSQTIQSNFTSQFMNFTSKTALRLQLKNIFIRRPILFSDPEYSGKVYYMELK